MNSWESLQKKRHTLASGPFVSTLPRKFSSFKTWKKLKNVNVWKETLGVMTEVKDKNHWLISPWSRRDAGKFCLWIQMPAVNLRLRRLCLSLLCFWVSVWRPTENIMLFQLRVIIYEGLKGELAWMTLCINTLKEIGKNKNFLVKIKNSCKIT